jgi:hypothetical protein
VRLASDARCYGYRNYVVLATPAKERVGENIVVYQRPQGSAESEGYDLKRLTKYMVITNDSANYFTGLDGDALFIISQTGPDGVFKIYDLTARKKVFAAGYAEGSIKIVGDNVLELQKLLPVPVHKLSSAEARKYPEIDKWLDQGGSAGWFGLVRISLQTWSESPAGTRQLRELQ